MARLNKRQTSRRVARIAGRILSNPRSSASVKAIAGSALAQVRRRRR